MRPGLTSSELMLRCLQRKSYLTGAVISIGLERYYKKAASFHHIYAENTLVLPTSKRYLSRVVASCHQPFQTILATLADSSNAFRVRGLLDNLRHAGAIIALTRSEVGQIAEYLNHPRVEYIPHGVDTRYFSPHENEDPGGHILTVGSWLRDWRMWADVVLEVCKRSPDIKFKVVASVPNAVVRDVTPYISSGQVEILSGIADEELKGLYRKATLVFLPLLRATANNAVLEGMATGLPIVASNCDAIRDYVPESGRVTCVSKEDFAGAIFELVSNRSICAEMGKCNRKHAVDYLDWEVIAIRTKELYESL